MTYQEPKLYEHERFYKAKREAADDLFDALRVATHLLERYRRETPLGNQPHMIAHSADAAVNVGNALLTAIAAGSRRAET